MFVRPIQLLGLNPDGVHRFLFTKSRDGDLYLNRSMAALEYGTNAERFSGCLDSLLDAGSVVATKSLANVGLEYFRVNEPPEYDSNDARFGQRGRPQRNLHPAPRPEDEALDD
jgi:hypothetical protein